MKNIIRFLFILFLLNVSCAKKTECHSFITYPKLTKSFTMGVWHFEIIDSKLHDDYTDYTFHFNKDLSFTVDDNEKSYKGKWNVISDNGTDDSPATDIDLDLLFTAYAPHKLEQLGHNYHILNRTKEKIELINEDTDHPSRVILFRI